MSKLILGAALLTALCCSCKKDKDTGTTPAPGPTEPPLTAAVVDAKATFATKALWLNLRAQAGKGVIFGQHDATMYGIGDGSNWWMQPDRSDVKSVTGEHPALYGWDIENLVKGGLGWINSNDPANIRKLAVEAYQRGGINTISWHMHNPLTYGNFADNKTVGGIKAILPGGDKHDHYKTTLRIVADFFKSVKTPEGTLVPIIFRPFHEHNYDWFWWGNKQNTAEEYKQLFQFTVRHLRDELGVHNVLYAYSPDRINGDINNYMERYPGDEYVDILGHDNYWEFRDAASSATAVKGLAAIVRYAESKNKVAALTETGLDKLPNATWYTDVLWNPIKADPDARKIAYMMVWRNANTGHFYAPYPGHPAVPSFMTFFNDPYTLFQNEVKKIYMAP